MQYVPVPFFLFVQLKAGLTVSIPVEIYYSINVCYTLIDLKTILSVIITLEQMDLSKRNIPNRCSVAISAILFQKTRMELVLYIQYYSCYWCNVKLKTTTLIKQTFLKLP